MPPPPGVADSPGPLSPLRCRVQLRRSLVPASTSQTSTAASHVWPQRVCSWARARLPRPKPLPWPAPPSRRVMRGALPYSGTPTPPRPRWARRGQRGALRRAGARRWRCGGTCPAPPTHLPRTCSRRGAPKTQPVPWPPSSAPVAPQPCPGPGRRWHWGSSWPGAGRGWPRTPPHHASPWPRLRSWPPVRATCTPLDAGYPCRASHGSALLRCTWGRASCLQRSRRPHGRWHCGTRSRGVTPIPPSCSWTWRRPPVSAAGSAGRVTRPAHRHPAPGPSCSPWQRHI